MSHDQIIKLPVLEICWNTLFDFNIIYLIFVCNTDILKSWRTFSEDKDKLLYKINHMGKDISNHKIMLKRMIFSFLVFFLLCRTN
jgi:hypothetical protein